MATKKAQTVKVPRPVKVKPEPASEPKVSLEVQIDRKLAKAFRHTAKELQGFYGLNVVGAALEQTAKALEDGKL
jgi:hypothetical protein